MKQTFQPNTHWKKKTHGFRQRMKTKGGRLVLKEDVLEEDISYPHNNRSLRWPLFPFVISRDSALHYLYNWE